MQARTRFLGPVAWWAFKPRIRLLRSFDQRQHSYQGYVLRVRGTLEDRVGEFLIAVGQAAHEKHGFQAGMELSGQSVPVGDARMETAEFYKTSGLKVRKNTADEPRGGPPFLGVPPDLTTYPWARASSLGRSGISTPRARPASGVAGCRLR